MVEIDQVLEDEELKSKVAAIGAGVLVVVAGFLVYNYFSKVGKEEGILREEAALFDETAEEGETPEELADAIEREKENNKAVLGEQTDSKEKEVSEISKSSNEQTAAWVATDYSEGDITESNYTVKRGDTLWEIAEARYGSGFEWDKILSANQGSIGFLPNGSQALIEVGQVLVLP